MARMIVQPEQLWLMAAAFVELAFGGALARVQNKHGYASTCGAHSMDFDEGPLARLLLPRARSND